MKRRGAAPLYGYIDAGREFLRRRWVSDAAGVRPGRAQSRAADFVGGSGLYFKALSRGLSAVPPIRPRCAKACARGLERDGVEALHAELARRDPPTAERLNPRDRTRIARALRWWRPRPLAGRLASRGFAAAVAIGEFSALFLAPDRDQLYERIDARFDAMLWRARCKRSPRSLAALDPQLPAMKAHGVPALIRHLGGEITLRGGREIGRADTRDYAKRHSPGSATNCRNSVGEAGSGGGWLDDVIPGWSREKVRNLDILRCAMAHRTSASRPGMTPE